MPQNFNFSQQDLDFDQKHIWHPYTSLTQPLPVYPIVNANGTRLQTANGQKLIDGMSSWWAAIHGYNHPVLNQAIQTQLSKMSHVMFGGITHQAAIDLSKTLVEITPKALDCIFLCDSGSVSVEVAMKVAIQYQHALGKAHKSKFLTFKKGYHGDTTAAMSVCDPVSGMHHLFKDFLPQHFFAKEPVNGYDRTISKEEKQNLADFFEKNAEEAAAFIFEPVVQGAGGMRIYSPDYVALVRALCKQHGLLMIADEIATGFGRTGKLFAVEHAEVVPDIICLGKALTGGYMTMAAMMCTRHVAETICNGEAGVLMHGPTFMGNPLAASVAHASLQLLLSYNWKNKVNGIENILKKELSPLVTHSEVKNVRVLGAIGVVECEKPVDVAAAQRFYVKNGVWIRPFRNLIYVMPPYVIGAEDLEYLCKVIEYSLREAIFKISY